MTKRTKKQTKPDRLKAAVMDAKLDLLNPTERKIYRTIGATGSHGMTCQELEVVTGWAHESVSARLNELRNAGVIRWSGFTRLTKRSCRAHVHVIVPVDD